VVLKKKKILPLKHWFLHCGQRNTDFNDLKINALNCYKNSCFAYKTIAIFAPKQLINLIKKKTMKKTLLISAALLIGASSFAQSNRAAHKLTPLRVHRNQILDASTTPAGNPNQATAKSTPNANTSSTCYAYVTKAPNVLSVAGGSSNNCFTYNKDLNAISWTCRSGGWVFPGSSSGTIKAVWKNMAATATAWDSMVLFKDSTSASSGGRYPGGALLNPNGNTNIAKAYWLAAGPHVGTAFDGVFYSARKAAGTYHNPPLNMRDTVKIPSTGTGGHKFGNIENDALGTPALNVDMQAVGTTKAYVTGPLADPSITTANGYHMIGAALVKASITTGSVVWSVDSVKPAFYKSANKTTGNGVMNNGQARLAFGPDSMIGYLVFSGVLAATAGNSSDSMYSPIVYKTTNGGTTWNSVLPGYGWMENHPECMQNVCMGTIATNFRNVLATHYSFNDAHGADLAVDAAGVLHYVTTVGDAFKNGMYKDSMDYEEAPYQYDYVNYHPIIWDFMTDGTCWKTMFVDSIVSAHMGTTPTSDTTALNNQWYYNSGATYFGYGAEINVSRSWHGSKIFYGWSDTPPFTVASSYNVQPDLFIKGYDVNTYSLTATNNITNGNVIAYFPRLSDIATYDTVQSQYMVPAMITNGTILSTATPHPSWDGEKAVDFRYINCATFNAASFANPSNINAGTSATACHVGIKTNTNAFVNSVSNYPNPFNNTTNIVVNLNEGKSINVTVFDAIGKIVSVKNVNGNIGNNTIVFEAGNLNAGVYYYTVTSGYDKVTKKMVIQK